LETASSLPSSSRLQVNSNEEGISIDSATEDPVLPSGPTVTSNTSHTSTKATPSTATTRPGTRASNKATISQHKSNTPKTTTSTSTRFVNANRAAYNLPLTQEQKDLINAGKAPFPLSKKHTDYDYSVHGLCTKQACKSAVEAWWYGTSKSPFSTHFAQLVSVSDFKQQVPQIKQCSICSHGKKCPKILQSMSEFQSSLVADNTFKRSVPLFEIKRKT